MKLLQMLMISSLGCPERVHLYFWRQGRLSQLVTPSSSPASGPECPNSCTIARASVGAGAGVHVQSDQAKHNSSGSIERLDKVVCWPLLGAGRVYKTGTKITLTGKVQRAADRALADDIAACILCWLHRPINLRSLARDIGRMACCLVARGELEHKAGLKPMQG
jgi:hypothetical protein